MKRAIPSVPRGTEIALAKMLDAIKENIEDIIGARGGKIAPLDSTATLSDVIDKVNALIKRIQ